MHSVCIVMNIVVSGEQQVFTCCVLGDGESSMVLSMLDFLLPIRLIQLHFMFTYLFLFAVSILHMVGLFLLHLFSTSNTL
jgi:hypothetical protein